jgi:NitT/TauT family transport system substrate-binding protein
VVPSASSVQSLAELKGKTISVPFASTAHGMLLRAVAAQGWDPLKDVNIIAQPPEVAGSALQAGKIDAHADFVPFAELFPSRGFARKIYDGAQANAPTFHGALVDQTTRKNTRRSSSPTCAPASRPTVARRRAGEVQRADRQRSPGRCRGQLPVPRPARPADPRPDLEAGIPPGRGTSIDTLKLLKKADRGLDTAHLHRRPVHPRAFKASKDYDKALANYAQTPLKAVDAATGKAITDFSRLAEIWVRGEESAPVRLPEAAFTALAS